MPEPKRVAPDPALQPLLDELRAIREELARPGHLLLTHEQAAEFLGVSRSAWFRLVAAGDVRLVNVPTVGVRFRRDDLVRYVEKLKTGRRKVKAEAVS